MTDLVDIYNEYPILAQFNREEITHIFSDVAIHREILSEILPKLKIENINKQMHALAHIINTQEDVESSRQKFLKQQLKVKNYDEHIGR